MSARAWLLCVWCTSWLACLPPSLAMGPVSRIEQQQVQHTHPSPPVPPAHICCTSLTMLASQTVLFLAEQA